MKTLALCSLTLTLALPLLASPAYAGFKGDNFVVSNPTARNGAGAIGDARAENGPNARIELYFIATTASLNAYVMFWDYNNTYSTCWTSNSYLVSLLQSAKSDSYVSATWDASGQCTMIHVANDSAYAPKVP
jgi:hypothetical protein